MDEGRQHAATEFHGGNVRNCSRLHSRGSLSAFVHYATDRDLLNVLSSVRDLFSHVRRNATDMCIGRTDKCLVFPAHSMNSLASLLATNLSPSVKTNESHGSLEFCLTYLRSLWHCKKVVKD